MSEDKFKIAATGMLHYSNEYFSIRYKNYIWHELLSTGGDVSLLTKIDIPISELYSKGGTQYSFFLLLNETENYTPSLYNYGNAYFVDIINK